MFLSLLTFEVDLWGRRRQQTKAARAQLASSEEDRKTVATVVVSDVATNYFNLLELDLELEIAKRTLRAREESLRIIKARQQGGLATMLDVRQAEELVYQASQTIPDTERLTEQTENQINLLLGNNPGLLRVALHSRNRRNCRLSLLVCPLRCSSGGRISGQRNSF